MPEVSPRPHRAASLFSRPSLQATVALALIAAAPLGHAAQQFEWAMDASAGYDTNPGYLGLGNKGSETLYAGGSVFLDDQTARLKSRLGGTGGFLEYSGGAYPSRFVGALDGQFEYQIVPRLFFWTLDETFGQSTTNMLAGPSPSNMTNVNLFSTGPQFHIPLADSYYATAGGQVGFARYESGSVPDDSRRSANLALTHQLAHFTTVSLQGDWTHILYSNSEALNPTTYGSGYDLENLFGRYVHNTVRSSYVIDLGEGRVRQAGIDHTSPTFRFNLSDQILPHFNLGIAGGTAFSDTAQQFRHSLTNGRIPLPTTPGVIPGSTVSEALTSEPVRADSLRLVGKYVAPRTIIVGGVGVARNEYLINSVNNTDTANASISATRRMTHKLDLQANVAYEHRKFLDGGTRDGTITAGTSLGWHLESNFLITASYLYTHRAATSAEYDYVDNKIYVGVRWSPYHQHGSFTSTPNTFMGVGGSGSQTLFSTPGANR